MPVIVPICCVWDGGCLVYKYMFVVSLFRPELLNGESHTSSNVFDFDPLAGAAADVPGGGSWTPPHPPINSVEDGGFISSGEGWPNSR